MITRALKPLLLNHIKEYSIRNGIYIDTMNCVEDHIHLLISLGSDQTIMDIARRIKGESSYWVNKEKIIDEKFGWQNDYYVTSVNEAGVDYVRNYIRTQEEHHKRITFEEEYRGFISEVGLEEKVWLKPKN